MTGEYFLNQQITGRINRFDALDCSGMLLINYFGAVIRRDIIRPCDKDYILIVGRDVELKQFNWSARTYYSRTAINPTG